MKLRMLLETGAASSIGIVAAVILIILAANVQSVLLTVVYGLSALFMAWYVYNSIKISHLM